MDARELVEWSAFERLYGPVLIHERVDVAAAHIAFMLSDGKRPADDFMPDWGAAHNERPRQSVEDMIGVLRRLQKPKGADGRKP